VSDGGGGYGNPCIETVCQTIEDGDTDDFEDDEISEEE
jgi:hypothetical protein